MTKEEEFVMRKMKTTYTFPQILLSSSQIQLCAFLKVHFWNRLEEGVFLDELLGRVEDGTFVVDVVGIDSSTIILLRCALFLYYRVLGGAI